MAKIVFITSRFPYPINKGDQLRVFFQLKSLSAKNEIYLIALNDTVVDQELLAPLSFCKNISVYKIPFISRLLSLISSLFNGNPFQVGYFYDKGVARDMLKEIHEISPDYIHCHLLRTAEYAKNIQGIEKSIDFMDAFSIGMKKRGDIERNPLKRLFLFSEYHRLKKYEADMFNFFDRYSIISQQDADVIDSSKSGEIAIVPNGVDFESFYPRDDEKKYDICFMGNMSYPPNVEAICYTMENIFPLLLTKKPDIKFLIAGANPSAYIKQLQSKNIDVIDKFDHISDSIAMSRIMISPMVVSIGLQNKIIQAMAMKVPNVVSKSANMAVQAKPNVEIIEADDPNDYIDAIIRLLEDREMQLSISKNAYDFVITQYEWEKVNSILEQTITGLT